MEQTVGWKKEGDVIEGRTQEGRRWNREYDLGRKEMELRAGFKNEGDGIDGRIEKSWIQA